MLNSEHLSLANKIGEKTEFTITRVHCTIVANSSDPITENLCLARFLGPGKNCVSNLSVKLKGHKYLFILLINLIYSNQFHINMNVLVIVDALIILCIG